MKVVTTLCCGILLWITLSFAEINLQNKAPHPDYSPANAFVLWEVANG